MVFHLPHFPGQNATITCKVGSVPHSRVKWYQGRPDGGGGGGTVVGGDPSSGLNEILNNSVINRGEQRFLIFEETPPPSNSNHNYHRRDSGGYERTSTLLLTNVREVDSGQFMCVTENQAGRAEANFTLQVRAKKLGRKKEESFSEGFKEEE